MSAISKLPDLFGSPAKLPVQHEHLRYHARSIGKQIGQLAWQLKLALVKHRESVLDQQFLQARLADVATELFVASCVYARLTSVMVNGTIPQPEKEVEFDTGRLYLRMAVKRNQRRFDELRVNFDEELNGVAEHWLKSKFDDPNWVVKPEESEIPQ